MIKEMLSSTLQSLEAASKSPPNSWDGCLIRFHSIMPHPFDMFWGAGEVTQFCESEAITTPTTKWTLHEYSGPVSPPWEANTWVPFSFLWLETEEALLVKGDWQLSSHFVFCMQANSSFTSFVYTLMQSSTPISPFHKGDKSFLWKRQPKSPSVYAKLWDLDFMQTHPVLI